MKRNENLIPLSREHHYGLLCVWKIREGVKKNVEQSRIAAYIKYFWENHLEHHFATEDECLPPLENEALNQRMEKEHQQLRSLVERVHDDPQYQTLLDFAKALNEHIRFEERTLFPQYEETLSSEILDQIGEHIDKNATEWSDNYPDEFWK